MDIENVHFPLARTGGFKAAVKTQIGRALAPLAPGRVARIEQGRLGATPDLLDRLLLAGVVARHEERGTLERLNGLHDWLWSSDGAVRFHSQAEARFQSWWLDVHSAVVAPLEAAIAESGARTLCEIGCGSGRVLQDLSRRLPQLEQLIGLDLSATQTQRNRARYAEEPRLRFHSGDAVDWIGRHAQPRWAYFTNAGVLEYLPQARLSGLLAPLATRLAPAVFAIVEPVDDAHDLEANAQSYSYGPERSWSHNYPALFRAAGWRIDWQREQRLAGLRWQMLVARSG